MLKIDRDYHDLDRSYLEQINKDQGIGSLGRGIPI